MSKTENLYGYSGRVTERKKKGLKKNLKRNIEKNSKKKEESSIVIQKFESEKEKKRSFYKKIGCLVEMDSRSFISDKSGPEKEFKSNNKRKYSTKNHESERSSDRKGIL